MTTLYCNDPDCRYAMLDGTCSAPTVKVDHDDGFPECLTWDGDCGGMDGYQEPYWISCKNTKSAEPPKIKIRKLGRKMLFGAFTFYTSERNPMSVTEARTGMKMDLRTAKTLHKNRYLQEKLANVPDADSLPTGEEGGDK